MTMLPILFGVLLLPDPESAEKIEVAVPIVEIEDDGGQSERQLPTESEQEKISITSRRADFDRQDGVVMFEGDAKISYSAGYHMKSDRLFVFFVGSNEVNRIVAVGNVAISNETRLGRCATAVFRRSLGEVEMFGDKAGTQARLAEAGSDEIAGRRIKFWVDNEQVEIDGSSITFAKSDSVKKGMKKGGQAK